MNVVRTRQFLAGATALVMAVAACSPPLAQTPTAVPTPAAAPKPTAAPAAPPVSSPVAAASAVPATGSNVADAEIARIKASYYEAAKKEGKLVVYGVGNDTLYNPVKDAFMKEFPGIELQGVDQRGRETREKILAEQQSKNYVVDAAISGASTQAELIDAGVTEDYASPFLDKVVPSLKPQYAASTPRTVSIYSIAVNTTIVKPEDEPKSWADVLDPKWKGKLSMDDPRGSGPGGTILAGVEGTSLGLDWTAKLAKQDVFFATQAGPLLIGLARGERAMYISAQHTDIIAQKQSGAPFKQVRPAEGVGLTPISQSLIKNAPHPNAAKMWIDWSLSQKGQQVLADLGYGPVREGIKPNLAEASLENTKILPRDDDKAGFQSLEDRSKRWINLFFK